ncbi:MAG: isopentenyl transferase family protein, partial [Candidatus Cybelea sp.]
MPDGVLILTGATGSGKTEIAVALAREFDAEIVGADSRQIYRGMPIGTAAPSAAQMAEVPHHLVGFLDPHERYSAARFTQDAVSAIRD